MRLIHLKEDKKKLRELFSVSERLCDLKSELVQKSKRLSKKEALFLQVQACL